MKENIFFEPYFVILKHSGLRNLKNRKFTFLFLLFSWVIISAQEIRVLKSEEIGTGSQQILKYLPLIKDKNVAVVANQTSLIGKTHLVDSLISLGVKIKCIFAPEHGFRGDFDAGEKVSNGKDLKTGLPLISLFGKHNKPTSEDLKGIQVILYDIQDVGVRFYTYNSTMSLCMEAAAENNLKMIVLDRPNPNGFYIDGPVLDLKWKSFLGMHPVPLVYGMTSGEYAQMVNGEGWLKDAKKCDLVVIPISNYTHFDTYEIPQKPSPNLPNMTSVYLYPSLGLFEGTVMSVGRGTDFPFQVLGHPEFAEGKFTFVPKPNAGAKNPKYLNQTCRGYDLRTFGNEYVMGSGKIYLFWLSASYKNFNKSEFFDSNFNYHAGNDQLKAQIISGIPEEEIRKSWEKDIQTFKIIRKKYLLYKDFE